MLPIEAIKCLNAAVDIYTDMVRQTLTDEDMHGQKHTIHCHGSSSPVFMNDRFNFLVRIPFGCSCKTVLMMQVVLFHSNALLSMAPSLKEPRLLEDAPLCFKRVLYCVE